jgi:alginate O-acetyltransferase complex protein AlgI
MPSPITLRPFTDDDWGLLKKWVVADRLALVLWPVFTKPAEHSAPTLWLCAMSMYAMLYLDFSAYTDLARGSARLFGVDLVRNFDRSFLSTSTTEAASRWHMSLFRWIGNYVHGPLMQGKLTHARIWRTNLLTMGLFGLWHGAGWTFVIWGLGSGCLISIEHSLRLRATRAGRRSAGPGKMRKVLGWASTVFPSTLLIVLFFSRDLNFVGEYYAGMLRPMLSTGAAELRLTALLAACLLTLFAVHASGARFDLEKLWQRAGLTGRGLWFLALLWSILAFYVPQGRPFIYFQF